MVLNHVMIARDPREHLGTECLVSDFLGIFMALNHVKENQTQLRDHLPTNVYNRIHLEQKLPIASELYSLS